MRPAHVVYRTTTVVAFMDQFRQPFDVGHVLVIPRAHVENIFGINDELGAELFAVHALIARAVDHAFRPDGISTWSSNGAGANQEVPHFHLHVYPRRIGAPFPAPIVKPEFPLAHESLGPAADAIRQAIDLVRAARAGR